MNVYSPEAEELLMATCANESNLGQYRTQEPHGPARGIFQMEDPTHKDIWENYLAYHLGYAAALHRISDTCTTDDMVNNDAYAIGMARMLYERCHGALPAANDIEGIWAYYKLHYNTPLGAAKHDDFIAKYNRYVLGQP